MFKSLDILVGVATVMLVLSLVVTVLTQLLVQLLKLRSCYLRAGILDLFGTLQWRFSGESGRRLAEEMAGTREVLAREELVETLLACADGELRANLSALAPACDFGEALATARRMALGMAVERPDMASAAVRGHALLDGPAGAVTSQVFSVFDAVMDRAAARFTAVSRWMVLAFATLVAVGFPVDTFDLFQRFGRSDAARAQAVQLAESLAAQNVPPTALSAQRLALERLEAADVIIAPKTFEEWQARIAQVNWAGVAVSALLLSLGAPFWFHTLQDLMRLRSAAAGQERRDREMRDDAQAFPASPPAPSRQERLDRQS